MNKTTISDFDYTSLLVDRLPESKKNDQITASETYSIADAGFIFSFELKREKLRSELSVHFNLNHPYKELDFIANNQDVSDLLPDIGAFFRKEVSGGLKPNLELLEEGEGWTTLFINIPVKKDTILGELNDIIDSFYEKMFVHYPSVMEKLNVDLVIYEI